MIQNPPVKVGDTVRLGRHGYMPGCGDDFRDEMEPFVGTLAKVRDVFYHPPFNLWYAKVSSNAWSWRVIDMTLVGRKRESVWRRYRGKGRPCRCIKAQCAITSTPNSMGGRGRS